jgi:hypothetical protein
VHLSSCVPLIHMRNKLSEYAILQLPSCRLCIRTSLGAFQIVALSFPLLRVVKCFWEGFPSTRSRSADKLCEPCLPGQLFVDELLAVVPLSVDQNLADLDPLAARAQSVLHALPTAQTRSQYDT